jgi:hypothetical protein
MAQFSGGRSIGNQGQYDVYGNRNPVYPALTNIGPFVNLQANDYWSMSPGAYNETSWMFDFGFGYQFADIKDVWYLPLWAVRGGGIGGAQPIPEPASLLLLGSGLVVIVALKRKSK